VPLRFAPLLYNLKMHIGLVRERVKAVETGRTPAPSADDRH